ncbi:MAG: response regulator transcription factor [Solirubrobacterales bacterium]|nr:response regulator transcription factor [Solirubrobacterales bacterium]
MSIRVLVADDHNLTLEAVKEALRGDPAIKIVAEASSGRQALALATRSRPDVALLDMHMPGSVDGLTCTERIKKQLPETRVVIISAFNDEASVRMALRRGADAFISKAVDPRDIGSTLRTAVQRTVFHAPVDGVEGSCQAAEGLTERELAVIKVVAAGLPNKMISERLWISEHTVKFHLTNIFRKTDTANRTEAARWAHKRGLISDLGPAEGGLAAAVNGHPPSSASNAAATS